MKKIVLKYKQELIGASVGAGLGLGYWFFIGCSSGSCAITSNPIFSSLYGAIIGWFLTGIITTKEKNKEIENEKNRGIN